MGRVERCGKDSLCRRLRTAADESASTHVSVPITDHIWRHTRHIRRTGAGLVAGAGRRSAAKAPRWSRVPRSSRGASHAARRLL